MLATHGGDLVLGRAERYTIEQRQDGVVLRMRQGGNALGLALVFLGFLFLVWWSGPYGRLPAQDFGILKALYWILFGFFACGLLLSLLAAFYRQNVTITDKEIIGEASFCMWTWGRRIPKGPALGIWIEAVDSNREGVVYPFHVHLLDAGGKISGLQFELQRGRSVERMLEALRSVLTLDVRDQRPPQ
jgi:hypothetical protein